MKIFPGAFSIISLAIHFCTPCEAESLLWLYALEQDEQSFAKDVGQPLRNLALSGGAANEYRLETHRVLAVRMGSGCARTAAVAASALTRFPCDRVVTTGVAGSLDEQTAPPGTWLRIDKVVPWQQGSWKAEGFARAATGEVRIEASGDRGGSWRKFPSVGSASGEVFVGSSAFRRELRADTGCAVVEMNLFGLHAALGEKKIPVLHLRVVSDRADDRASDDFRAFVKSYDGQGGRLVVEMLRALPADEKSPANYPALRELLEGGTGHPPSPGGNGGP